MAVRHYKAPRRTEGPTGSWSGQSDRTGGVVDRGDRAGAQGGDRQHQHSNRGPVGHQQNRQSNPQQMMGQRLPDPVQISKFYDLLSQLGSLEVPGC